MDLGDQISRAPPKPGSRGYDQWGLRTTSTFHVVGRHVLNVWRIMRVELSLTMYTFENVAFHLLRRRFVNRDRSSYSLMYVYGRIPKYSPSVLTSWCQSHQPGTNFALVTHVLNKCVTTLEILSQAETVTKNSYVTILDILAQFRNQIPANLHEFSGLISSPLSAEDLSSRSNRSCSGSLNRRA